MHHYRGTVKAIKIELTRGRRHWDEDLILIDEDRSLNLFVDHYLFRYSLFAIR